MVGLAFRCGCEVPFHRLTEPGDGSPPPRFQILTGTASSHCKDQHEVDYYWDRLTDGGAASQCGWCRDRFGLSWQVVPERLYDLVSHPDPARATAATQAMYGMRKIVVADLESAAASG